MGMRVWHSTAHTSRRPLSFLRYPDGPDGQLFFAKNVPPGVLEILKVPDVGPKTTLRLWKELDITDLDMLRTAIEQGKVRQLKGMGEKSEAKMLAGMAVLGRKTTRKRIDQVDPFADDIIAAMQQACGATLREICFAGSLRRRRASEP